MYAARRAWRPLVLLSLSGLLLSCGGDGPTEPPPDAVVSKLAFVTPPPTTAFLDQALSPHPVIQLLDAAGKPVAKAGVVLKANFSGTTAIGANATTTSDGRGTFSGLVLRGGSGTFTLTFTTPLLEGVAPLEHQVKLSAFTPSTIVATSITDQAGGAGMPVVALPTVRVTNELSEPAVGTTVTFTIESGGGTLVDSIQTTDANGTATVGDWITGLAPGTNTVRATAAGISGGVTFSATGLLLGQADRIPEGVQVALVGTATELAPKVRVRVGGEPVRNTPVRFRVVSGGGSVAVEQVTTDAIGEASSGTWTLGPSQGENILEAEVPAYAAQPLQFQSWGLNALPASLEIVAGDSQTVDGGELVPVAPAVRVTDGNGLPLEGYPVIFIVPLPDHGTITGDSTVTDAQGIATLGSWRVALANGERWILADAGPISGSPATFIVTIFDDTPALIQKTGGQLLGEVAQPLGGRPRVRITTAGHTPLEGLPVEFTVASGSGSITGTSQLTDANGEAELGSWTLGTTSGEQRVVATSGSLSLEFVVNAYPARPVSAVLVQGDGQSGPVYNPVPLDVVVRLEDQFGNPTPNILASIGATVGSGRVGTVGFTTDSRGEIRGRWYLGGIPGPMELVTNVPGQVVPQLHVSATAVPVSSAFDIEAMYVGAPTTVEQQAVDAAIARWRTIIQGDIAPLDVLLPAGTCTSNQPAINQTIDDLMLLVDFSNIDGPGNVLGSAGPCAFSGTSGFPAFGVITIDGADAADLAASGGLFDVMLHELGHVLGIGTVWTRKSLLTGTGGSDPQYTGIAARQAYNGLGGTSINVPVENQGGVGTRDSHWRETVFGNELMTGFIGGGYNPLSRITSRSLVDLGYVIEDATADPLSVTLNLRRDAQEARARLPVRQLRERPLTGPIIVIYPDGSTEKVPR